MVRELELLRRADELRARRMPFVLATVVRARPPTSAKPGDRALLLADGTIEGFVGGACSETTVRTQGLRQLAAGQSVLLRIMPAPAEAEASSAAAAAGAAEASEADSAVGASRVVGAVEASGVVGAADASGAAGAVEAGEAASADSTEGVAGAARDGIVSAVNPCLSGGVLDIFLEVMRPAMLVHIYGDTPVARAIAEVARAAGLQAERTDAADAPLAADTAAVVVASQGGDEGRALRAALRADVPYVGLVASRKRGTALAEALELDADGRARLRTPAGLNVGAGTPGEIAVSILAEIIAVASGSRAGDANANATNAGGTNAEEGGMGRRNPEAGGTGVRDWRGGGVRVTEAADPVCGMSVVAAPGSVSLDTPDGVFYFCRRSCRDAYVADPGRYTRTL